MDPQAIPAEAQQVIDALPPLAVLALGALAVLGGVLWLLGRSLAKPACVISGLVLGGLGGYIVGQLLSSEGAMTLPLVLGGAIAGALLAGLLFRVWMGASAAVILALAVPAVVIIWQGTPFTLNVSQQDAAADAAREADPTPVEADDAPEGEPTGDATLPPIRIDIQLPQWPAATNADEDGSDAQRSPRRAGRPAAEHDADASESPVAAIGRVAAGIYNRQADAIGAWWDQLGSPGRWLLGITALAGAGVGLILGLAAPSFAASVQAALVGSILLLFPLRELAEIHAPGLGGILPTTPRATLVALGLITLLGVLVQWALFRRRADR